MAPLTAVASAGLLLLSAANAHFTLNVPVSIGFDDDNEGNGPCGGITPDFSKQTVSDFHVDGEPVGVFNSHSQATWLYRGTLDQTGNSNWTQLFPIVQTGGVGNFCEIAIPAPASWVGKKGIISVVDDAPDGLLFQCALVNFVTGTGTHNSANCGNSTTQAAFVGDAALQALVGNTTSGGSSGGSSNSSTTSASPSNTASNTASTTSSTAKPSTSGNAAAGLAQSSLPTGSLVALIGMFGLGAMLL